MQESDKEDCLILFNNVKEPNDYPHAFDRAKTRFLASCNISNIKIFYEFCESDDIEKIIKEILNQYNILIFAVFDQKSLVDGNVSIYYTLDDNFNYKSEFKQKIRADPGATGVVHAGLNASKFCWEDYEEWFKKHGIVTNLYWGKVIDYIKNIKD